MHAYLATICRDLGGDGFRVNGVSDHAWRSSGRANILSSPRAVQMSVFVIRAFVKMRETLLGTRELARKLAALEKQLTGRLDSHGPPSSTFSRSSC
jgi:hypothetical protein